MTQLNDFIARRSTALYVASVMVCGFLTFYSLPDAVPLLVRLAAMVAIQYGMGRALQRSQQLQGEDK